MSDVIEGMAFGEAGSVAPEAASGALVSETVPEIIVEGEGDLRLRDFFAPRLWGAALIPLLFTAITSNMTVVRVSDAISPLSRGIAYEDLFFQPATIPLLGRHLLPFGLPFTTDSGFGYSTTSIMQSNLLVGLLALLVGALLVSAVTRRTNDAIYVAGPYFAYSCICIALLWNAGRYFQTLTDLFPALLAALLAPILVGVVAKIIGVWMRNQGWLEADLDQYATENAGDLVLTATDSRPDSESQSTPGVLRHVTHALACPFCGNPKIAHDAPHSCGRCHRAINLAVEHPEHPCPNCEGALVTGAEFCHHCAMWLKGLEEPLLVEELGAA